MKKYYKQVLSANVIGTNPLTSMTYLLWRGNGDDTIMLDHSANDASATKSVHFWNKFLKGLFINKFLKGLKCKKIYLFLPGER